MNLFFVGWAPTPVASEEKQAPSPETVLLGLVGGTCGNNLCVDVYKVRCPGSNEMWADVTDDGVLNNQLIVTLIGQSPTSVRGDAQTEITSVGGTTPWWAIISRANPSTLQGYVMISSLNGATSYLTDIRCVRYAGPSPNPVITQVQEE